VCPNGFRRDLLGREVCDCAGDLLSASTQSPSPTRPAPPTCAPLIGCTKECFYGYRTDRLGCPRCRCNRCPPLNCAKKCRDGFAYGADGCKLCRCLGQLRPNHTHAHTTVSRPLYRSACVSRHLQLRTGGFCWCKVLLSACPC